MRLPTRILSAWLDRITDETRGARQKILGLTRRGLCRDIKGRAGRALDWSGPPWDGDGLKTHPYEPPWTSSRAITAARRLTPSLIRSTDGAENDRRIVSCPLPSTWMALPA